MKLFRFLYKQTPKMSPLWYSVYRMYVNCITLYIDISRHNMCLQSFVRILNDSLFNLSWVFVLLDFSLLHPWPLSSESTLA